MRNRQHIVKSIFWLTVAEIIFNVSGYIVHFGVGRILGPADYGRYGLVVTLTTMIVVLIGNGVPTAMSKFLSEFFETRPEMIQIIKKKSLIIQAVLIASVTLIFFLSAPLIARALGDDTLTPLFQLSALIIPAFAAASFYFYYFTGIHYFNIQAILKTIRSIAKVIFIVGLAWLFGIKGSIGGYIAAPLLVFAIAWIIDKFWINRRNNLPDKNPHPIPPLKKGEEFDFSWKKIIDYAWPLTLFMLFYEIMISIDLYMVKKILSDDYLTGIYNGALTAGRIPYYLFYALTIVLFPTISKTTALQLNEETKKIISQTLRFLLVFLFPCVILLAVFAEPIISIFYGSQYTQAAQPMRILTFGMGFLTVFYVLSFVINGAGKVKVPMLAVFFGAIANFTLNYFLINYAGILGAAAATTAVSFFMMIFAIGFIKKYFDVSVKFRSFLKIIFASAVMFFFSFLFPSSGWIFIIWSLILLGIYFTIIYALKEIKEEDAQILKKAFIGKK